MFALLALMGVSAQAGAPPAAPRPNAVASPSLDVSQATSVDVQFDDAGKPKSCRILQSSGSAKDDAIICAHIMAGQAVISASPAIAPPGVAAAPRDGSIRTESFVKVAVGQHVPIDVQFDDAGKPISCRVTAESKWPKSDAALCADMLAGRAPVSGPSRTGAQDDDDRTANLLNISEVFRSEDYPLEAIAKKEEGTTVASLSIDPSGRATACRVSQSSGSPSLDKTSCALLMERGRFEIGRDADGKPVARVGSTRVRWALPDQSGAPFAYGGIRSVFGLDSDANVTSCRYEGVSRKIVTSEDCQFLRPIAAKIVEHNFADGTAANRELVLENGILLGTAEGVKAIGGGPGVQLVRRAAWALTIDPHGRVVECKVFEIIGTDEAIGPRKCAEIKMQVFEPLATSQADRTPRHAVAYLAIYVRPRP